VQNVDAALRSGNEGLSKGARLGPYRIDTAVGEGGMGQVFRAVRVSDGETVALKVMKAKFAADTQYTRRFLREARAASSVQHKHLVSVLDAGEEDGRQYLAMRYVPGRTLEQRLEDSGPFPLGDVNRMVAQVGGGLDALHEHRLVHRDVKSSNIILDSDGSAALTDFGLAKGAGYSVLTQPGQMMGTLDYIAPELIRGQEASPASDIYALGCVVFECACGTPPFGGKSMFEVGMAHLDELPPDPSSLRRDLPAEYGQMVLLALAKDPAARPPTGTAYGHLLTEAARGT
jgi:serine/threonine protein kinase